MKKNIFKKTLGFILSVIILGSVMNFNLYAAPNQDKSILPIGADFADITMPEANPGYDGFIADPTQDVIPVGAIPINTPEQLAAIGGEQSAGKYYVLANNIILKNEWIPIDDFRGILNGQGYSIQNLYTLAESQLSCAGLFGRITANNVTIKNVSVNIGGQGVNSRSLIDDTCAGGLAGYISGTITIQNCYVTGNTSASFYSNNYAYVRCDYAGGLAGRISGTLKIENCYFAGTVTASGSGSISGDCTYAGGLIGSASDVLLMQNCYATGDVFAPISGSNHNAMGGGLIGDASGIITNCYATGDITVSTTYSSYLTAGGLVGSGGGAITNCYAAGDVSSSVSGSTTSQGTARSGGVMGYVTDELTITNCYAAGDISASARGAAYAARGDAYAGGLVGFGGSTITNSHATGDISASARGSGGAWAGGLAGFGGMMTNCYASGNVSASDGTAYAGGLVGYYAGGTVTSCHATGDISASTSGDAFVGGLAGIGGTITNSHATGDISASTGGASYAGGLTGFGDGTITNSHATGDISASARGYAYAGGLAGSGGTVANCYAVGDISASAGDVGGVRAGGLAGSCDTVTNCYATGDVTAFDKSPRSSSNTNNAARAGGLVGNLNNNKTIEDCYAMGSVIAGSDENLGYAGGLVGYAGNSCAIINCYAKCDVTAVGVPNSVPSLSTAAGGLIGYANTNILYSPTITNSYRCNAQVQCFDIYGTPTNNIKNYGISLTPEEMKNRLSFTAWNFDYIWNIDDFINDGYPFLRAFEYESIPTYGISFTPSEGSYTFPPTNAGYGAQTPYSIIVSNTGKQATGTLTVALSGTNASSFTLNKTNIASIAVNGSNSFTIVPKNGLASGTYTAIVTVSGVNVTSKSFTVSFTVTQPILYGDVNDDGEITISDLVRLARHIADIEPIKDSICLKAADVNGDGKVNIADLIRLSQLLTK